MELPCLAHVSHQSDTGCGSQVPAAKLRQSRPISSPTKASTVRDFLKSTEKVRYFGIFRAVLYLDPNFITLDPTICPQTLNLNRNPNPMTLDPTKLPKTQHLFLCPILF